MHFTGTIWRPPYEAWSALLQVTAGCTHNKCKFCTLYNDVPQFRMSPLSEIESDLQEIYASTPDVTRLFLTGANPFVLDTGHLKKIADLAKQYLQRLDSIGCFARITDITTKSIEDLKDLRVLGYNRITIGVETGDDAALEFMRKGYSTEDIITQCRKLDFANIEYNFFYLTGISGNGNGMTGAEKTAKVFNRLNPKIVGASMLTVYPDSDLYKEILLGNWQEESETEKLLEMRTLIEKLDIRTHFAALGASNMFKLHGELPYEKQELLGEIDDILSRYDESKLRNYRVNLKHL
ncbi:MAG: radical SAM protein [Oscillospiraceae bacterium]|nr:radical SAM protein [Oscillospiraceae bacterium]